MKIRVDLKIFIVMLIFLITNQFITYWILMGFVLLHELAHLLTGILLGLKAQKLEIMPMGISITFKANNKKGIHKLLIALAGPLSNIIIAIIFSVCQKFQYQEIIIYANIIIAIFNLIPIYPLDGGRILKSILEIRFSAKYVATTINKVSNVTIILLTFLSSIGIIYFKNIAILIAIVFLWIIIILENKKFRIRTRINTIIEKDREKNKQRMVKYEVTKE